MLKLNVGGRVFITTKDTITNRGSNMLSAMLSNPNPAREVDGAYFIDRDPEIFRWLLLFLRGSDILPKRDSTELWLLKEEAEYFAVDELCTRIQHMLSPQFKKNDNVCANGSKFTVIDVQRNGYLATRAGQQFKLPAISFIQPTTIQKGDVVMAWSQAAHKRRPGVIMNIMGKDCTVQFQTEPHPITCPVSSIRF